jgi:alpha-tubulin suppressor-like RCC1 family protein
MNSTTSPTVAVNLGTGLTATAITCSASTCALLNTGNVKCWWGNYDSHPTLGAGAAVRNSRSGYVASELGDGMPIVDLGGLTVAAITGGAYHICGLLSDATAKCWGWNNRGQLGQGDTLDRGGTSKFVPDAAGLWGGVNWESEAAVHYSIPST